MAMAYFCPYIIPFLISWLCTHTTFSFPYIPPLYLCWIQLLLCLIRSQPHFQHTLVESYQIITKKYQVKPKTLLYLKGLSIFDHLLFLHHIFFLNILTVSVNRCSCLPSETCEFSPKGISGAICFSILMSAAWGSIFLFWVNYLLVSLSITCIIAQYHCF